MFDDWNQIECPLNFSVILWKSWTSWRTRVNSSEPFQWPFMTCKYCHFPTCFCGETEAVRGLGRKKTVVGSDSMWFHWNSLEKDENFRKSYLFDVFPRVLLVPAMFFILASIAASNFQGFRGHGWSQAGRLLYDCTFWGVLEICQENLGFLKKIRI